MMMMIVGDDNRFVSRLCLATTHMTKNEWVPDPLEMMKLGEAMASWTSNFTQTQFGWTICIETYTHTHRDRDIQLDRISDNIQCLSSHCQNRPEKDWNTWWEQTRICWRQTNLTCFHDIRFLANYWQIKSSTMCRNICDDGDQNWGLNDFNSFCFSYFSSTCEFKQQPIGSEYILIVKLIQFRFCRIYNS